LGSPRPSLPTEPVRLQRYLAACGLGSRRACESLIARGIVCVDGRVIDTPGYRVDPAKETVSVRGRTVCPQQIVFLALHKPRDIISTVRDPQRRRTLLDLVPDRFGRLYPVGRLDRDTEGLILLTNDGDFAHRLMHPRHHVPKVYHLWVSKPLSPENRQSIMKGVKDRGELLRALSVQTVAGGRHRYEVTLGEGRNRHIRRLVETFGIRVVRLKRVSIGPLQLGRLSSGSWRELRPDEVNRLMAAAREA
jgi:23S rRNA pseudouridine2605 synthase